MGYVAALQEAYNTNIVSPKGSRKMISGLYPVYQAPNGSVHLFRFDWNSGFAKIWWPGESIFVYAANTSCPKTNLNDRQLLRATIATIISFGHISMSKPAPIPTPVFINRRLHLSFRIPIYFSIGCGSNSAGNRMYFNDDFWMYEVPKEAHREYRNIT